jgi:hypothetical protein
VNSVCFTLIDNCLDSLDENDLKTSKLGWWRRSTGNHEDAANKYVEAVSPVPSWKDLDDRTSSRRQRQVQSQTRSKNSGNCSGYPRAIDEYVVKCLHQTATLTQEEGQDGAMVSTTDEWGRPLEDMSPAQVRRGGFFWNMFQKKQLQRSIYNVDSKLILLWELQNLTRQIRRQ